MPSCELALHSASNEVAENQARLAKIPEIRANWNAATRIYTDGENSVTVNGISADKVTLKFGDDASEQYAALTAQGAFAEFTSEKIFEEQGRGLLA